MDLTKWARSQWDRIGAGACIAGGALALLFGWIGVSGSAYPAGELPYIISGGIGGIFLLGVGSTLWLSADLRDEWRKLDRLEAMFKEEQETFNRAYPVASANDQGDVLVGHSR